MEAGGFETLAENHKAIVNQEFTESNENHLASSLAFSLQNDPGLGAVVDIWPTLPQHIKSAIKALIQTCTK
jgi:hypothetical protein